jgi:hypothetical protein
VREEDEAMGGGAIKAEGSGMKSSGERDAAGVAVMNDAAAADDADDCGADAVAGREGSGRTSGGAVTERFRETEGCCCCCCGCCLASSSLITVLLFPSEIPPHTAHTQLHRITHALVVVFRAFSLKSGCRTYLERGNKFVMK